MNRISTHFWLFILAISLGGLNLGFLLYLLGLYKQPAPIIFNCDRNTLIKAGEAFEAELTRQNDYLLDSKKKPVKKANTPPKAKKATSTKSNIKTKKSVENQK